MTPVLAAVCATAASAQAPLDRTQLPVREPARKPSTTFDVRNAKLPPHFEVKPPSGAPNVVIVLIDDFGFGHSSAFGGPCRMPTCEQLARNGLRFNRFHTTALCSPTRTALLTGRNHHVNNAGAIMELATAFPGNTGVRPDSVAPLAEILRLNGYSTAAFGKYHETPPWEASVSGPFDRWPTRSGFDKFYGFIGGETNQWAPAVYDGTARVEVPRDPNYHFTTDMTNQAIAWVRYRQALTQCAPNRWCGYELGRRKWSRFVGHSAPCRRRIVSARSSAETTSPRASSASDSARRRIVAGAALTIANRDKKRGQALAEQLGCKYVRWENRGSVLADILINCTPVGMSPNMDQTPFAQNWLRDGMLVFDTIYNPESTLLIKEAREHACTTISGLEMFVRQAAAQFECFVKQSPPIDFMRKSLRSAISPVRLN